MRALRTPPPPPVGWSTVEVVAAGLYGFVSGCFTIGAVWAIRTAQTRWGR